MTTIRHINNGTCPKCVLIFARYPGFPSAFQAWFTEIQGRRPEAHISCAGRGAEEQNDAVKKRTSRAKYGQSAHNFNMAIDVFKLHLTGIEWPREWFSDVIATAVAKQNASDGFKLKWYGATGSAFFELPHIELADWKTRPERRLVEPLE
jgi:hypothetical protein